ncbi:MAG: hypothetical protein AAFQ63_16495 [Cyanobacteria bacterium J06621_11]
MKTTTANNSAYTIAQLAQRLNLGRVFEGTYGAGAMTEGYKREAKKADWTTNQLLTMSAAKSFYN